MDHRSHRRPAPVGFFGADTLSLPGRKRPFTTPGPGGDGRGFPRPVCFGAQDPETGSPDQMGLQTERVGDGGVAGAEPLISALGCELPLLSFSSADDQVAVLDPVILVYPARPIVARQAWTRATARYDASLSVVIA